MIKYLTIILLFIGVVSCGESEDTTTIQHEKYYIEFVDSGKVLDDKKCSYGGGHNEITFSIGKKAKISVLDLYTELKENEVSSRVGHSYPAVVTYDDQTLEGELRIDNVEKEPEDKYGQNHLVSGIITSVDDKEIKFVVSLYNMND